MKKLFALLMALALLLGLAACGDNGDNSTAQPDTTPPQAIALAPLTPKFLSLDTGREALKPLIFGSDGWRIDAQGSYIIAYFSRYILRYDVKTNTIDKIINLGEAPQYWYYAATFSPNGQSCVAEARELDGTGHTGKALIDFKNETSKPTGQEHFPHSTQSRPCNVERRLMEHGYGLLINDVEIKALQPYAVLNAEVIVMDESRIGALLPVSENASGYLGYYKFAVIDLAQDKIVQECPMNVLAQGEEYPTFPAEPEQELVSPGAS